VAHIHQLANLSGEQIVSLIQKAILLTEGLDEFISVGKAFLRLFHEPIHRGLRYEPSSD